MSGYWDPHIERMPLEDLHALQEDRLKSIVRYVYDHSAFYRRKFNEAGVEPGDIQCLADITKLPFTKKIDLRDNYPTGMFSAPKSQIVRYHVSSGTTGKPTVVGYTKGDIETWSESLARALTSVGLGRDDVVRWATATASSRAASGCTTGQSASARPSCPWAPATQNAR